MSLVGFKAQNHPQQETKDDVDDRRTPNSLFDPLHATHHFTVDAAASEANALLPRFWTKEDDGLAQSWAGERVWCNPPYSRLYPWTEKALRETTLLGCPLVVMLLPANRCEQKFWQEHIEPFREGTVTTQFLAGRLRFERPGWTKPTKGDRPPFGLVIVTWTAPETPA